MERLSRPGRMRRACAGAALTALTAVAAARDLGAQVPAELRGRVTDVATARPVVDARIDVAERAEPARTDADGVFLIRGLEPREYSLHVRAVGFLPLDVEVEVANGRTASLELQMRAAPVSLGAVLVHANLDSQAGGAVTFDRQAIEASGKRDVGELLQATPGVVITQTGGAGAESHASIRGSSANEVLVIVDGVPLNSAISGDADLSRIPLESVERVTVRTGTQSAQYGDRAMAGVIDIQTRRPSDDASLLLRAGAWGEREVSGTVGGSQPDGQFRAGGSVTGDYRTIAGDFPYTVPAVRGGGTANRINSDATSRDVTGALTLDGDSLTNSLRGTWQESRRGLAGSIVQPSSTGRQSESRQSGGVDSRWLNRTFTVSLAGDVTHEHESFDDPTPPFGSPYADTVNATSLLGSSSIELGRGVTSGDLGAEARGLDVGSAALAPGAPRWQRLVGAWVNGRSARSVSDGMQLGVEGGVRVDNSSLIAGSTVSPRAAASLTRGSTTASLSLGSGYAAPTLADQFFHEGVLVRANPSLEPERTRKDLEARLTMHETEAGPFIFSADAAAYRSDIDGMILWLPDFQFVWSPANYAVHRSGWELGGRSAVRDVPVDVQATLNHADVVYAGPVLTGQVAYRPRTTGSLTAGVNHRAVRVEATTQYVGARRTVPGSALNALDPYWLTSARITSTIARRGWTIDAALGAENLFDESASMLVDYPFPSRTWSLSLRLRRNGSRDDS